MSTAEIIAQAFQGHPALTIADVQRLTGLHPARIRHAARPPQYKRVTWEWATRRWEGRWTMTTARCECGQWAWYRGHSTIHTEDKTHAVTWLLCEECAGFADEDTQVEALWHTS